MQWGTIAPMVLHLIMFRPLENNPRWHFILLSWTLEGNLGGNVIMLSWTLGHSRGNLSCFVH